MNRNIFTSADNPNEFYRLGVIDILQNWNTKKKVEAFLRDKIQNLDKSSISAIDPI